ncbi:hypothetical protein LUZ60_012780 [Juncus effusus]|nr:hypothetical protein LUZ60_012780 [Juncus effusus]
MALSLQSSPLFFLSPSPFSSQPTTHKRRNQCWATMASSQSSVSPQPPKLVTFIGKGGSGKTTASVLAAKYYASEGLNTCLVSHTQDPTIEHLMGLKLQNTPTKCGTNLSAVKLETSKMLLEPLDRLKKVDARLNLTQGILEGIVGEELGVLPGMDSFSPILFLQKLVNFISDGKNNNSKKEFDVVIYDGISSEETLRLFGATERSRSYLKYVKEMAEKTDIGRLISPSILKLFYDSIKINNKTSDGKSSSEIWSEIEQLIEKTSVWFTNPRNFACYLITDINNPNSVLAALRYWGCAIQAGAHVSGAFGLNSSSQSSPVQTEQFSPLPFSVLHSDLESLSGDAKDLLKSTRNDYCSSVSFDVKERLVTLFMPGFDKSEIKLFQYRGGAELLVEAGDQRRVVKLPLNMQGKVAGAKFIDRNLIVKLK